MKRKWARLWIKDLMAGHKQATHMLYNPLTDGHCCLGRLCRIVGLKPIINGRYASFKHDNIILPAVVMRITGMHSYDGKIPHYNSLATMNDKGMTFPQIAAIIRKHWRDL